MLVHSLVILVSHFNNVIRMTRSNHYLAAHFLLRGVGVAPAFEGQTIPAMVYMIFQAMFACLTPGKKQSRIGFLISVCSCFADSIYSTGFWCCRGTHVGKSNAGG